MFGQRRAGGREAPEEQLSHRRVSLPVDLRIPTQRGEHVLAAAQDDLTRAWVALTTYRIVTLTETAEVGVDRPWHEVDTGAWEPDSGTLSLTWVGGGRGLQWQLRERTGPGQVPQVFRERVSASVVLVREVDLGARRSARVSIRSVLSTRELVDQVLWGRGAGPEDPELAPQVEAARQDLRDQVGLPPGGP